MGLQVRVWGVRGSGPECGPEYQEYGGNTSCVTVHTKDKTVILDAEPGLEIFVGALSGRWMESADVWIFCSVISIWII